MEKLKKWRRKYLGFQRLRARSIKGGAHLPVEQDRVGSACSQKFTFAAGKGVQNYNFEVTVIKLINLFSVISGSLVH